jgi:periplasmic protein TonB
LPLGTVEETISVGCSARATVGVASGTLARLGRVWRGGLDSFMPVLAAQEPARTPVRVGGNIQPPRKVKDVRPVCPVAAVPATGATVKLTGRIGVDGLLNDVTSVPSAPDVEPPGELTQSALEAVRQWTFTPTRLNGQVVETNITIRISYQ